MTEHEREEQLTLLVIAERMRSLREISEYNFRNIRDQLDVYKGLPVKVEKVSGRLDSMELEIRELKETGTRGVEWRRGGLPIIFLTIALCLVGVAQALAAFHV